MRKYALRIFLRGATCGETGVNPAGEPTESTFMLLLFYRTASPPVAQLLRSAPLRSDRGACSGSASTVPGEIPMRMGLRSAQQHYCDGGLAVRQEKPMTRSSDIAPATRI